MSWFKVHRDAISLVVSMAIFMGILWAILDRVSRVKG